MKGEVLRASRTFRLFVGWFVHAVAWWSRAARGLAYILRGFVFWAWSAAFETKAQAICSLISKDRIRIVPTCSWKEKDYNSSRSENVARRSHYFVHTSCGAILWRSLRAFGWSCSWNRPHFVLVSKSLNPLAITIDSRDLYPSSLSRCPSLSSMSTVQVPPIHYSIKWEFIFEWVVWWVFLRKNLFTSVCS